jgi:hypothetical protein
MCIAFGFSKDTTYAPVRGPSVPALKRSAWRTVSNRSDICPYRRSVSSKQAEDKCTYLLPDAGSNDLGTKLFLSGKWRQRTFFEAAGLNR